VLTGDYLTTEGQSAGDDIEIIERAGLEPNVDGNEFDPSAVKARAPPTTMTMTTWPSRPLRARRRAKSTPLTKVSRRPG